jgi:hypothetical protein
VRATGHSNNAPLAHSARRFLAFLLSITLLPLGCAVTGPRVTAEEEAAARGRIQQADYRIWWDYQKRLLRVSDRFAWGVATPGAPYRNAFGILPALRKSASSYERALYQALGNPRDGTVIHVSAGSPGAIAGIEEGDRILSVDDKAINTFSVSDLTALASKGQSRRFSVVKRGNGETKTLTITPGRKLDITFVAHRSLQINANARKYDGMNLITVYYGVFNLTQNDDELAVFVGHEIVHILKDHLGQSATIHAVGSLIELGIAIAGAARGVDTTNLRRGVSTLTQIVDIRYTREQEREADYLGMYAAHQAGFNVAVAPTLWEKFAVAVPQSMNDSFFMNHPPSTERLVRVQKTAEEIERGRILQEVWNGDFSDTQLASNRIETPPSTQAKTDVVRTPTPATAKPPAPVTTQTAAIQTPISAPMIASSLQSTSTPITDPRSVTKTYASLVQYDGPKVKAGVTLDAQFLDDGSGRGEGFVNDVRSTLFKGTFTTVNPGAQERPRPKILDRATLNNLQMSSDKPWVIATFSNSDTVLECIYGEIGAFGQKKGACRDNFGNRYHLYVTP